MIVRKFTSALTIALFFVLCWLSFHQLSVPEPALPGYAPSSYSAYRAIEYLKRIAKEPHNGGSTAHKKVRNYIYDFCVKRNVAIRVLPQVGLRMHGTTAYAGNAYNILAKLEGAENTKAILVMAHYDSRPNSTGAADDGSGVAGMLEIIDLLYQQETLKNDVYFLFTDLEEVGLLGAEAFVNYYDELHEIGLILNFESRGNKGISFTFETSDSNGWVIQEFAKAADKSFGNSLAYEIYKMMPNDSDFTMFRDTGITGLNSAFIDGYSYYHSIEDTPQNISLGSLQHQGDLMWELINHFGNIDLTYTHADDVIFFKFFNYTFIYPKFLDWPLIILNTVLFAICIWYYTKKRLVVLSHIAKGSITYLLAILTTMGLTWLFNWLILTLNPHFSNFYSSNFYNSTTYLWVFIGGALLSFSLIYTAFFKRNTIASNFLGGLVIHLLLILVLKFILPTGAFILYVPMLIATIVLVINVAIKSLPPLMETILIQIMPIALWVPFIYILFIVFSHSLPYAAAFFIVLLFPYLLYIKKELDTLHRWTLPTISLVCILTAIVVGQLTSDYNEKQPLQTRLAYVSDVDTHRAFWVSAQSIKDDFIKKYITSDSQQYINDVIPNFRRKYWKSTAPDTPVDLAKATLVSDTVLNGTRQIKLNIAPMGKEISEYRIILPPKAAIKMINDRMLAKEGIHDLLLFSPKNNGDTLVIEAPANQALDMILVTSKPGIDRKLLTSLLPPEYIFGPGSLSNKMLVKQTIVF